MSSTTTAATTQRPTYPIGVPSKFSPDGTVQRYRGNTLICHLPDHSPLLPGMRDLYDTLSTHPVLWKQIYLLPPASWHMTVLDCIREEDRESGGWPAGKEKMSLEEYTAELSKKFRELGTELEKEGLAPPYHMRVRGFDGAVVGIGLEVEGATPEEEKRIRRLRDMLADARGFRSPDHEKYGLHISMAYLLRHIDGKEREELNNVFARHLLAVENDFDLGPVEFCTFENMLVYSRLFYLGERD